jgi:hypothetical protein
VCANLFQDVFLVAFVIAEGVDVEDDDEDADTA